MDPLTKVRTQHYSQMPFGRPIKTHCATLPPAR
jgi:hypothetical protein